jgi:thiol-disulfide isomerase/thioredoxin
MKFMKSPVSVLLGAACVLALLPVPAPAQEAKSAPTNNSLDLINSILKPASANTNADSHTLAAKDADGAWTELQEAASRPPSPPDEWELKEPSAEEQSRFFLPHAVILADKAVDFYSRFPTDTNALPAKMMELGIITWALDHGGTNQQGRFDAVKKSILADPKLSEDDRFDIRDSDLRRAVQAKESEGDMAMLGEFEKGARLIQKELPKRPEVIAMLLQVAENSDPDKARAVLKEIATNELMIQKKPQVISNAGNSPAVLGPDATSPDVLLKESGKGGDPIAEFQDAAANMKKHLDAVGSPFTLKFTAVDGREVDLAKMQGKVVLVDFWASGSEGSVEMIPDVQESYAKFHAKGLEVVGINLDDEKESLTNFVSEQKIAWPQYFDGQVLQTKFAVQFGVKEQDVPALWLVDKKGVLRYINGGFDMDRKISGLLSE